jgi:RNA polymerase sigma-70 factor (ECF subfamily)
VAAAWRTNRAYLVDLAFLMLGDVGAAEDVVQEAFARLARVEDIDDDRAWLTVVTSRLCLDQIRSARARRELAQDTSLLDAATPVTGAPPMDPADRITLDDDVRLALFVVLQRLGPAERVAFVLHDVFAMPFEDIAQTLGRPIATCRQLAKRARQKIAEQKVTGNDVTGAEHREVTEKFITACTNGDIDALRTVLAPDVWGLAEFGDASPLRPHRIDGREPVARNLIRYWSHGATLVSHPVGDQPAVLAFVDRELFAVITFTVTDGLIAKLHVVADPAAIRPLVEQMNP